MTNKEILKRAIERAEVNGYKSPGYFNGWDPELVSLDFLLDFCITGGQYYYIIFSYEFAKALNYKLADLGAWCDEGKEPLKFIERLLD
jgi:hypothetical protein